MEETVERIADKVRMANVKFDAPTRSGKKQKAVVTYSKSTTTLYFNLKMIKLLKIEKWTHAIIGYDRVSNIIILKNCDAEEYGAMSFTTDYLAKAKLKPGQLVHQQGKRIRIAHIVNTGDVSIVKSYRAEREGAMIFLERTENAPIIHP